MFRAGTLSLLAFFSCNLIGCSSGNGAPPEITAQQREAVAADLLELGAQATGKDGETLYLSLRNTHVQIGAVSGLIESSGTNRRDMDDFVAVAGSIAGQLLNDARGAELEQWLKSGAGASQGGVTRIELEGFRVSLSRQPLRLVFSQMHGEQ